MELETATARLNTHTMPLATARSFTAYPTTLPEDIYVGLLGGKMDYLDQFECVKEKYKTELLKLNICIYKILIHHIDTLKIGMVFVFFIDEATLKSFSQEQLKEMEIIFIELLKREKLMPQVIDKIAGFYFDSDENVQKNFHGSYYLATL